MNKKLKIVIADNSTELGQSCANALKSYGMDVILCEKDGQRVLEKTLSENPDVVLADVFMPNLDILGVLGSMKNMEERERPMVMAMSSCDNQRLEKETLEAGASYYFLKPFDINTMAERIIQLSGWRNEISPIVVKDNIVTDPELELMITEIIHQIGVPAHIKGYPVLLCPVRQAPQIRIPKAHLQDPALGHLSHRAQGSGYTQIQDGVHDLQGRIPRDVGYILSRRLRAAVHVLLTSGHTRMYCSGYGGKLWQTESPFIHMVSVRTFGYLRIPCAAYFFCPAPQYYRQKAVCIGQRLRQQSGRL